MTILKLRNSATRDKEPQPFEPIDPSHVRLYVCGPTVYDRAHIGNARPVVVFDVLVRLLRRLYPRVTYVRNITDVDDKIMAAARERGEPIEAVTERTLRWFHEDMAALGALPPDVEPRATETIAEMITLIKRLIANGHAYAADGHVLFHVPSYPRYGALSNRTPDEMEAGARVDVAPYKRSPYDFVLWKPSTADQPGWDSPWGRGRPGWHIECSAMSWRHLGEEFDIHGGGLDLIFPHHENEIAQSVCAFPGSRFARVWMHNGMLLVNGEKMSKSLGNFVTVEEVLQSLPKLWAGESFRFLLLKTHYRNPLDFSMNGLRLAYEELDYFYRTYLSLPDFLEPDMHRGADTENWILEPLLDDLNTPLAISRLHRVTRAANSRMRGKPESGDEERLFFDDFSARELKAGLRHATDVLGILQVDPEKWPYGDTESFDIANIQTLVDLRSKARKEKNFSEADRIRKELEAKGVLLDDTPEGTKWRRHISAGLADRLMASDVVRANVTQGPGPRSAREDGGDGPS